MGYRREWSMPIGPPAWTRRSKAIAFFATLCGAAMFITLGFSARFPWSGTIWAQVIPASLGLLSCIVFPLQFQSRRHIRRAWRDSGGRLCTHCAYDLSALEPEGLCPECGRAYDVESDAILWKVVGLTRDKPSPD